MSSMADVPGPRAWGLGIGPRTGQRPRMDIARSLSVCLLLALGPMPGGDALGPSPVLAPTTAASRQTRGEYVCPMHPDQRADVPGKCGICGMLMVKMPPARFDTYPVDLLVTPTTGGARLRLAVRD